MAQRYAVDAERFPGRVIAGTETWGHMMYTFWKETERLPHVIGDFVWTAIDYLGEAGGGAVSFDGKPHMGAPYPYHLYGVGDFDICGFKRPQSYYRDLLWGVRTAPFIAVLDPQHHGKPMGFTPWGWEPVLDTWTFPGQEGKPTQVDVYSIDDEVELLVNGVSPGRKPAGAAVQNKASFDVTYQPGTIEAVGLHRRQRDRALPPGDGLRTRRRCACHADRAVIQAGGGDLAYVTIEVQDQRGRAGQARRAADHRGSQRGGRADRDRLGQPAFGRDVRGQPAQGLPGPPAGGRAQRRPAGRDHPHRPGRRTARGKSCAAIRLTGRTNVSIMKAFT